MSFHAFDVQEDVARVLAGAGWSPTRQVPTTHWEEELRRQDFTVSDAARRILSNLGGLHIVPPKPESGRFAVAPIDFDPLRAGLGERDRVADYEEWLGEALTPLGEVLRDFLLMASPAGRIYVGRTRHLELMGDSIEDALELLVRANRRGVVIRE